MKPKPQQGTPSLFSLQVSQAHYGLNFAGYIYKSLTMIEKQSINGQDVWLEIEPYHVKRDNPKTIPTEYFTARYYLQEPASGLSGKVISEKDGNPKLFESPVAALEFTNEKLFELI